MTLLLEIEIKSFDRRIIYELIKNKLIEKKFISSLNFLIYSVTYVISLTITLHPFKLMISYLGKVQEAFTLIKYLRSHYVYILIKSIYKYYIINKETFKYPSMNLTHIKMYFYFLANSQHAPQDLDLFLSAYSLSVSDLAT